MNPTKLYCPNCRKHTQHVHMVEMYATRCLKCNTYTSQLERVHVENLNFTAPDGTAGIVVHHTPELVTFYVESGPHAGYYHFNKHTQKREVSLIA